MVWKKIDQIKSEIQKGNLNQIHLASDLVFFRMEFEKRDKQIMKLEENSIRFPDEMGLIMKKAFDKWGVMKQMWKTLEELAEFQNSLCELMNIKEKGIGVNDKSRFYESLIEETADLLIMVKQVMYCFSIEEKVNDQIHDKLEKFKKRLF